MDKIKLIICDIDGTMVKDIPHIMTNYTKEVIQKVLDREDLLFGIASGRAVFELKEKYKEWNFDRQFDCVIGMNGCEMYDKSQDKEFSYMKLKKEWIKEIIELMEPWHLNPYIYTDDKKILCLYDDEKMEDSSRRSGLELIEANDISDFWKTENAKIMMKIDRDRIDGVIDWINERKPDYIQAFKTAPVMIEFAVTGVSKAVSLEKYCSMHNIKREEVIAFGDNSNDNEMLKWAGTGVCMLNGSKDTKASADIITSLDNNHDGLAYFIEENILKKS